MKWNRFAKHCRDVYGSFINWDDKFVTCPECREPIYEEDYPEMEEDEEYVYCPICEEGL